MLFAAVAILPEWAWQMLALNFADLVLELLAALSRDRALFVTTLGVLDVLGTLIK